MRFETFRGTDLRRVFDDARAAFGADVLIVRSDVARVDGATRVEVVAAHPDDVQRLRRRLSPPAPRTPGEGPGRRALVLALVGPTGAGKTTTAAKLALSAAALGGLKVGLVTLDTFKVGALEQMQTVADIAGLPLEVLYDAREVAGAMRRLEKCDAIIIDTPGRGPRESAANARWQPALAACAPDEIHLVVPATLRLDLAGQLRAAFARCAPTHALLTKADEVPADGGLAALAARLDLPVRWLADGQRMAEDLHPARGRILAALGLTEAMLDQAVA